VNRIQYENKEAVDGIFSTIISGAVASKELADCEKLAEKAHKRQ
jgi:hypothetical protein